MKSKKKWTICGIVCAMVILAFIHDTMTLNNTDYTFVIATTDKFYEETYETLEKFFEQFGIDQNRDGKVRVVLDRLSIQADLSTDSVTNTYEDGVQLLKMMTEITVLKRNIYILDTETLELLNHYNDRFFSKKILLSDIADTNNTFSFDQSILGDYWICIRDRDTFEKINEADYKKDEIYMQQLTEL